MAALPEDDQRLIAGSRERLLQFRKGKSLEAIYNEMVRPEYRLKRVGDILGGMKNVADRVMAAVARRAEVIRKRDGSDIDVFRDLWNSDKNHLKHLEKRLRDGSILNEEDYVGKTFNVLAEARTLIIAEPDDDRLISAKAVLEHLGWVVLLSEHGTLITSYPADQGAKSFEDNHRNLGDRVYDQHISEDYRRLLKTLFTRA